MSTATVKELTEKVENLQKTLDGLDKADYNSGLHVDPEQQTAGYWLPSDEVITVPRSILGQRRQQFTLPKNYRPHQAFPSFGDSLKTIIDDTKAKSNNYVDRYTEVTKAIQGMSETVGSDGGFAVLPEYSQKIFEKIYDNDLFGRTDNYTVSGNNITFLRNAQTSRADGSRDGGIQGAWTGEGGAIAKSKPTLGEFTMRLKKLAIVVYLTQELIDDAGMALEQYVTRKAQSEFNFMLGNAVINGTGSTQPLGIRHAGALLTVAKESGQNPATIVTANVDKMWMRRYAGSTNYVWLTNQDTHEQLSDLNQAVSSAGGQVLYRPPGGLADAPYATLKGRPIIETEFNETVGTRGDLILADLNQYITISKGGIAQAQSMHVEFLTDQLALRFTLRVDGEPWESSPTTPFKGSNTQASFIDLATRA